MSDDMIKSKSGERIGVREERSKGDPLRSLLWGLAFIALGSLLFAHSQGWLTDDKWFPYFLISVGTICVAEVLIRYLHPSNPSFSFARLITGVILIFIGVSFVINFVQWLPLVLIVVGITIAVGFYAKENNHSIFQ
ncbi:MAG: hypothetical protein NTV42_08130 [Chloroflexi bacterium]|nr:hypothetical protein [Chloroflexota bacterium]